MDNPSPVGGPAAASLSPSSMSQGSLARSHELRWKQEKTDAGRGRPRSGRGWGTLWLGEPGSWRSSENQCATAHTLQSTPLLWLCIRRSVRNPN